MHFTPFKWMKRPTTCVLVYIISREAFHQVIVSYVCRYRRDPPFGGFLPRPGVSGEVPEDGVIRQVPDTPVTDRSSEVEESEGPVGSYPPV